MKDRIRKIMESQHMSQKVFAQFTGISEGSLSGVFNGRTRPTIQMVDSIHTHLPNVSVEWIMYGTGPMYIDKRQGADEHEGGAEHSVDASAEGMEMASQPLLFGSKEPGYAVEGQNTPNTIQKTVVKYIDKPERHITEIRIFFDDQTWETFEPKR